VSPLLDGVTRGGPHPPPVTTLPFLITTVHGQRVRNVRDHQQTPAAAAAVNDIISWDGDISPWLPLPKREKMNYY